MLYGDAHTFTREFPDGISTWPKAVHKEPLNQRTVHLKIGVTHTEGAGLTQTAYAGVSHTA